MEPTQDNAVNQPVEHTTPIASAPIEIQATEPQLAPVESNQPERKVSDAVPYERFKEVNDRVKQLEDRLSQNQPQPVSQPQSPPSEIPQLDPESAAAVDHLVDRKFEIKRAEDFVRRNAKKLEDPILRGTVRQIIEDENRAGRAIDQDIALERAEELLNNRFKPQVEQVQKDAFEEGEQLARTKQQHGAIGETNQPNPTVDEEKLSADEFAALHGLKRVN